MAGSKLVLPANGAADWSAWVTAAERQWRGYMQISMSNMTGSAESVLQAGSAVEIGGSLYQFTSDEAVTTGWSAITTATVGYMKFVPTSTEVTWQYTAVAPAWDDDKQGWYGTSGNATHRYLGTIYKGGTSSYDNTILYENRRYQRENAVSMDDTCRKYKEIEIGDWDMQTATVQTVTHTLGALSHRQVRQIDVIIRDDANSEISPLNRYTAGGTLEGGCKAMTNSAFTLERRTGGTFDSTDYNATSYNRGWITVWYEP